MNELQIFTNKELGEIRALEINNEPWFVGKDIATILGYSNSRDALKKHVDEEDKQVIQKSQFATFEIPNRGMTIINESGLYSLILHSKLPNARKFKRWVTSEVLPQIRQTGGYIPFSQEESDEEILAKALIIAQNTLAKKNEIIEGMKPKVEYHDKVLNVDKLVTTTDIAKDLGMTARELHNKLHDMKIIFKTGNHWTFYAKYQTRIPLYADYQIGEHGQILKWTERGRKWIIKLLNEQKEKDEKIGKDPTTTS